MSFELLPYAGCVLHLCKTGSLQEWLWLSPSNPETDWATEHQSQSQVIQNVSQQTLESHPRYSGVNGTRSSRALIRDTFFFCIVYKVHVMGVSVWKSFCFSVPFMDIVASVPPWFIIKLMNHIYFRNILVIKLQAPSKVRTIAIFRI